MDISYETNVNAFISQMITHFTDFKSIMNKNANRVIESIHPTVSELHDSYSEHLIGSVEGAINDSIYEFRILSDKLLKRSITVLSFNDFIFKDVFDGLKDNIDNATEYAYDHMEPLHDEDNDEDNVVDYDNNPDYQPYSDAKIDNRTSDLIVKYNQLYDALLKQYIK